MCAAQFFVHGNKKVELLRGEQKSLQTDRVILVPGPEDEQRVVQRMYEMFVNEGRSEREIAETLNAEGHRTDLDRPWTRATVYQVLTIEWCCVTTSASCGVCGHWIQYLVENRGRYATQRNHN
jgi:hypothetical protein